MSPTAGTPASNLKPTGSGHGSSSIEPSPASTYGSSAASEVGEEQPLTPSHDAILPGMTGLTLSDNHKDLVKAQLSFGNAMIDDDVFIDSKSKGKAPAIPKIDDDVFTDSKSKGKASAVSKPNRVDKIRNLGDWRSESSSSVGSDDSFGSPSANRGRTNAKVPSSHRGGEGSHQVVQGYSSDDGSFQNFELLQRQDAQAIYPPSSCVFVANLLQSEADDALEVAVTDTFRDFGTVYVKIRRDPKQMPFAFCQFTNDANAERAIREGSGRLILGRACRVEKAKAHRLFFIERKYGPAITAHEAYSVLKHFGRINFCRPAAPIERNQYNLNEGVMVQYALYNDGQAAMQAYRNDDVYKVRSMASLLSPSRGGSSQPQTPDHVISRYNKLYDVDRRSVHVGNLPGDVTQANVQHHFQQCGSILRISIHTGPSNVAPNELYAFAFIEFELQPSADLAINLLNGSSIGNKIIRVAQKDTRQRRAHAGSSMAPGYVNTPMNQSPIQQQHFQTTSPSTSVPSYMGGGSPATTHWTIYNGWYYYWYCDAATGIYGWASHSPVPTSTYNSPSWYNGSSAGSTTGSPFATQTAGNYMSTGYGMIQPPAWNLSAEFIRQETAPVWNPTPEVAIQQVTPIEAFAPVSSVGTIVQDEDRSITPTPFGQTTVADSMESAA